MIKNKRNLFFLGIFFLFSVDSDANKNLESLMSILYSQTSGEIKATFVQTYNTATKLLDKAINDEDWDAVLESERKKNRTPAIILDVDETVLDNTPFNARSLMNQTNYPEGWDVWIYEEKANLIPGVKDFLVSAQNKGVKIFYVTNRRTVYEEATKNNIKKLNQMVADGKIKPLISQTIPMKDAISAINLIGNRGVTGKVVLVNNEE